MRELLERMSDLAMGITIFGFFMAIWVLATVAAFIAIVLAAAMFLGIIGHFLVQFLIAAALGFAFSCFVVVLFNPWD